MLSSWGIPWAWSLNNESVDRTKKINKKTYFRLRWFECKLLSLRELKERIKLVPFAIIWVKRSPINWEGQKWLLSSNNYNCFSFLHTSTLSRDIIKLIVIICTYMRGRCSHKGQRRPLIGQKCPRLNLRHKKYFLSALYFRPGHRLHKNIPGAIHKIFFQHTVFCSCHPSPSSPNYNDHRNHQWLRPLLTITLFLYVQKYIQKVSRWVGGSKLLAADDSLKWKSITQVL